MRQVLLLNSGRALRAIPWTRAMCLILRDKAIGLAYYDDVQIRTVRESFQMPSVICLKEPTYIPFRGVAINKKNLMRRDESLCQYCGKKLNESTATIDHIIPRAKGGRHSWKNVVCACKECNNSKDNKTPEEAGLKLLKDPRQGDHTPSSELYFYEFLSKDPYKEAWAAYL